MENPIPATKICKDQYDAAILIIEKAEEAKSVISRYEEDLRYENDPIQEIIDKGQISVLEYDIVPFRTICRVKKYQFIYAEKKVIQEIEYMYPVADKNFLDIKDQIFKLI